jgi:hypothetical protein
MDVGLQLHERLAGTLISQAPFRSAKPRTLARHRRLSGKASAA